MVALSSLSSRLVATVAVVVLTTSLLLSTTFRFTEAAASPSLIKKTAFVSNNEIFLLRGGGGIATLEDESEDEEFETDDEEEEEEESEDEDEIDLSAGLKSSLKAAKAKKTKKEIKTKLSTTKKKNTNKSLLQVLHVPYILRACLNPITLTAMIRSYFASLFDINYMDKMKDQSQNLRSALEEKAKQQNKKRPPGPGASKKGKRSMKPGQAKTLSDLPQLNT